MYIHVSYNYFVTVHYIVISDKEEIKSICTDLSKHYQHSVGPIFSTTDIHACLSTLAQLLYWRNSIIYLKLRTEQNSIFINLRPHT